MKNLLFLVLFITTKVFGAATQVINGNLSVTGDQSVTGTLTAGGLSASGNFSVGGQFRAADGSAASPSISLTNSLTSGIYRVSADRLGFSTAGVLRFDISSTALTSTLAYLAPNGSAASPSVSLTNSPTTGLYRVAADQLGVSTGGTLRFDVSTTAITSTLSHLGPSGSLSAPTYAFSASTNSGMFWDGSNVIISNAGVNAFTFGSSNITSANRFLIPDGTQALPGLAFTSDTNTGLWRSGSDTVSIVANGASSLNIGTSFISADSAVRFKTGSASEGSFSAPGYTFADNISGFWRTVSGNETYVGVSASGNDLFRVSNDTVLGNRVKLVGTTHLTWDTDDVGTIGRSNGNRPQVGFFTREVRVGYAGNAGSLYLNGSPAANIVWETDGGGSIGAAGANRPDAIFALNGITAGTFFRGGAGSAASPTFSTTADSDTGYYSSGTNEIGITTGGAALGNFHSNGLLLQKANVGTAVLMAVDNTNNSNGASDASLRLQSGGASGGDPVIRLSVAGANDFYLTVDNSDSDKFKIAGPNGVSSDDFLTISTAGLVTIGDSGGTQTHAINGNATATGFLQADYGMFDTGAAGGASQALVNLAASSGSNFGQIGNTGTRWSLGYGASQTALGTEVLTWNSSNAVSIAGTLTYNGFTDASSAASGVVGEVISCEQLTQTNFPTSGQYGDICNISLTAGDWDCHANATTVLNAAVGFIKTEHGIGTASGNTSSGLAFPTTNHDIWIPTTSGHRPSDDFAHRININSTTSYYHKIYGEYSSGNPQYVGKLWCRRTR